MRPALPTSIAALLAACTLALGCHAQVPSATPEIGKPLAPELARRVEILLRARTKVPPNYTIAVGAPGKSDIPGYDTIEVTVAGVGDDGQPKTFKPLSFLLSADGKTVAQFSKFDIAQDPRTVISGAGRPARGAQPGAPVEIVVFDDLECPYCARMHAQLFPALTQRYGDQVRVVYKDYPIPQHPWAMRAAVDTNCVGTADPTGYWAMVDYIHAHAAEFGGTEHSLTKANDMLDQLALDQAKKDKLDESKVQACVKAQDKTAIEASMKVGEDLDVAATPVLFINGERLEGAYPLEDVYRMVDGALVAAGKTPPPAYVPPPKPQS